MGGFDDIDWSKVPVIPDLAWNSTNVPFYFDDDENIYTEAFKASCIAEQTATELWETADMENVVVVDFVNKRKVN